MGKRVGAWSKYHSLLWPQHTLQTAFLEHGLGSTSISTTYVLSMIYWGFAAPREKWQQAASAQFLTDLVNLTLKARPGFQLYLPQPGAPPIDIDKWGCFELQSVVGSAIDTPTPYIQSVLVMLTPGSGRMPQLPFPCTANRPHIIAFLVVVLTPENCFPDWWCGVAKMFLRQLSDVINREAPGMMQGVTQPPGKPSSVTSDVGSSTSTRDPSTEEDLSSLTQLPSLRELEAALMNLCDSH